MRARQPATLLAAVTVGMLLGSALPARAADAVDKPVSTLVKAVRYDRDELALKQLDGQAEAAILLADEWDKATPEQRTRFVTLFHQLFAALAFPKIRENLQNLGTTLYEKPEITGDKAKLVSTLAIDHPLKKQEIRVRYDMHKLKDGWKVVDVTVLGTGGNSMLTDIRNDQIIPILKQGGLPHLLDAMQQRLDQVKKK
jgi:phospholipid transport system substrate-binding protein